MIRIEVHLSLLSLACRDALGHLFDAVVDGIAHHVSQRIAQRLDQRHVDLHVSAFDHELGALAGSLCDVARRAPVAVEQRLERYQP